MGNSKNSADIPQKIIAVKYTEPDDISPEKLFIELSSTAKEVVIRSMTNTNQAKPII
ncbi:hypothetical protein [Marinomonas sp.]|uniref:hypothetical protein n=1 Tax=Marinomonas sp. TaxID=1904862 RepID=UPI003A91ABC0